MNSFEKITDQENEALLKFPSSMSILAVLTPGLTGT
jgi:hypothetical protein